MAPSPSPQPRELSRAVTVAIASVGSVVAAIIVSRVWGPGTLIGAAATPVIITLVVEGLRRPVTTVVVRTPTETAVREVGAPRVRAAAADASGDPTIVAGPEVPASSRRRLKFALVTGLVAFVIGASLLTGTELIVGDSAGSGSAATTLFSTKESSDASKPTSTTETTPAVTETTTTTAPAEATPTPTGETTTEAPPATDPEGTTGATGATGP